MFQCHVRPCCQAARNKTRNAFLSSTNPRFYFSMGRTFCVVVVRYYVSYNSTEIVRGKSKWVHGLRIQRLLSSDICTATKNWRMKGDTIARVASHPVPHPPSLSARAGPIHERQQQRTTLRDFVLSRTPVSGRDQPSCPPAMLTLVCCRIPVYYSVCLFCRSAAGRCIISLLVVVFSGLPERDARVSAGTRQRIVPGRFLLLGENFGESSLKPLVCVCVCALLFVHEGWMGGRWCECVRVPGWIFLCVYVCMCICAYVFIWFVCIYFCMHVCVHVCLFVQYVCMYVCMCVGRVLLASIDSADRRASENLFTVAGRIMSLFSRSTCREKRRRKREAEINRFNHGKNR